jgi:exodeoxyribonuclease V gamma subunit
MRSIPFKVVCLLGMDDDTFPRTTRSPSFDEIARDPRPGDRTSREDDRTMFLEAVLSARRRLVITYTGQSIRDNSERPPSVVVSELLEALAGGDRLVVRHPLQPFSPAYFEGGSLHSYSRSSWEGATALVGERVEAEPFFGEQALDPVDGSELAVDDLLRYFRHPTRFLLQRRIGLYLPDEESAVDDREPASLGPLERHALGSSLLGRALEHGDLADAYPSVRAAGGLPLGAVGACNFADMVPEVETLGREAASWMQGDPPDPVAVDVTVGTTRLSGTLPGVWPGAQLVHGYGKLDARRLLDIWIRHLVLLSLEDDALPSTSVLVARPERAGGPSSVTLGRREGVRELLGDLVEVYLAGQREALPLFPAASLEYVDGWHRAAHLDDADRHAEAVRRASATFHRRWGAPGDAVDPYVVRAFGGTDPLEARGGDFARLSLRVLDPLLEGLEEEA